MLALASGTGAATKAEGDITVGPKALYTVSEDGWVELSVVIILGQHEVSWYQYPRE